MHPRHAARLAAHQAVSTQLSMLSDRQIVDLLARAKMHGSGIGGRSAERDVGGRQVFVKRVPLTDLETEHLRSTANLFDLPTFYQYGLGSAGFGAWRELATHTMTTNWVLTGTCGSFPLMYHWRVLPDSPPVGFADEFGGIDGAVRHWEGSGAVRARLEAIGRSTLSLVLFLEHIPHRLSAWLAEGRDVARHAWAERQLVQGADFMSAQGLVHFDAHFHNVLDAQPVPPALAAIIDRHAEAALVLHDFHRRLMTDTKRTPYPVDELRRASANASPLGP